MTIDRLSKVLLVLIGLALGLVAIHPWLATVPGLRARSAEAARQLVVPKDWGRAAGFIPGHVYLEAADGTIRLVNIEAAGAGGTAVLVITRK